MYFTQQLNEATGDAVRVVREIIDFFNNPLAHTYLKFLNFVLKKMQAANEILQAVDPIIPEEHDVMTNLTLDILSCYMKPQYWQGQPNLKSIDVTNLRNTLPLNVMDIGQDAKESLRGLHGPNNVAINAVEQQQFLLVCRSFYVELCSQLKVRLNSNRKYERARTFLNNTNALSEDFFLQYPTLDHVFAVFPILIHGSEDMDRINAQWRLLHEYEIPEEIAEDTIVDRFWERIAELIDDSNPETALFGRLCALADNISLVANSNASPERVWSKSGHVKPKKRNRLEFKNWRNIMLSSQIITDLVSWF